MNNLLTIILIGISLSMDALSLSIFLGTIISKKKGIFFTIIVGIFHFFMPILGALLGIKTSSIFNINGDLLFGIILIILSIQIFNNIKEEADTDNFGYYALILLAFGVAIDSFTIGFGLEVTNNFGILHPLIISICSMIFTYTGLIIGKYSGVLLGKYAKVIGGLLLLLYGIYHII